MQSSSTKDELLPQSFSDDDAQGDNHHCDKVIQEENMETSDVADELFLSPSKQITEEDKRLGGSLPLKTTVVLAAGPLISQITGALYGVINSVWIAKALGDPGLTAIASYQNFDTIGRSFAFFLQVSAAAKIASLFGAGDYTNANQVFSDLLRFSILCAIIAPAVCIPTSKICVKWFGAEDFIVNLGYQYIVPNLCLTIIPCVFLIGCGCLQAEGRSWLFSITQISALCLNMFVFCPLFLLGFKIGISGAAYANGFAELIPAVVVIIMYYRGKFSLKPKIGDMLNKFSPHTWEALKIGMAQFIMQLSFAVPGMFMRKLFGLACNNDPKIFNNIMAAFNAFNRFWSIEGAVPNAITIGFIPAASYAYGANMNKRLIYLLVHATWISAVWCVLCMILSIGFPELIAKIFSKTPEYLYWSKMILRNGNWATVIIEIPAIVTSLLQATKRGTQATILSIFVQLLPVPIIALILYVTDKTNIPRLVCCYPIQAVYGTLFSMPFLYFTLRDIKKNSRLARNAIENENEIENGNGKKKDNENNDVQLEDINVNGSEEDLRQVNIINAPKTLKIDTNGNRIEDFEDKICDDDDIDDDEDDDETKRRNRGGDEAKAIEEL